jgi:hypothetical protein
VARLNAALRPGIRFDVKEAATPSEGSGRRALSGGAATPRTGVLELSSSWGARSRAACPLASEVAPRRRHHALAGCLAECAMLLGLGTGVYRVRGGAQAGLPDSC